MWSRFIIWTDEFINTADGERSIVNKRTWNIFMICYLSITNSTLLTVSASFTKNPIKQIFEIVSVVLSCNHVILFLLQLFNSSVYCYQCLLLPLGLMHTGLKNIAFTCGWPFFFFLFSSAWKGTSILVKCVTAAKIYIYICCIL